MTKEDFENGYCERSEITLEEYQNYYVTLPCNCGHETCDGWASVKNKPLSIKAHKDLYM